MSEPFSIAGISEGIQTLDRLDRGALPIVAGSFYRWAEGTMTESKEQEVPVDTGALRSSGTVEVETSDTRVEVSLGFGGAASNYAVAVHETNKNYRGGRKWKYLEDPIKRRIDLLNSQIASDLEAFAGGQ